MARVLLALAGFLTVCVASSAMAEAPLPHGLVNVAVPEFGDKIGPGADYGLANDVPVEIGLNPGDEQEVRVFRTPRELRLSRGNTARFQIRLGDVRGVYFWLEAPPVHGQWRASISAVYPDGREETLYGEVIDPGTLHFSRVPPRSVLVVRISSVEQTFKLSKRFTFTLTPVLFTTFPGHQRVPYNADFH